MKNLFVASVFLLVSMANLAAADDDWNRVIRLDTGNTIRATTAAGITEGTLLETNAQGIRVSQTGGRAVTLDRGSITRVQLYKPKHRLRRFLIYTGAFAGGGVVAAFATCPSCVGELNPEDFHQRLLIGGLAGAGAGAGIGALSSLGSSYKTIYER